jgi:hypothetical protein
MTATGPIFMKPTCDGKHFIKNSYTEFMKKQTEGLVADVATRPDERPAGRGFQTRRSFCIS